jgi:hypothetical protein
VAVLLVAAGMITAVTAQDAGSDAAAVNARAARLDPEDYPFLQPVCTRCHDTSLILHSRSWSQWRDVLDQMKRYGAKGSQEQWQHILAFVGHHLTLIDVNRADEDELSAVLGVDENTAVSLVQRRSDRRFRSVADIEAVPGVDKEMIEAMEPRLLFAALPEEP